jgi:hypothetical protein
MDYYNLHFYSVIQTDDGDALLLVKEDKEEPVFLLPGQVIIALTTHSTRIT